MVSYRLGGLWLLALLASCVPNRQLVYLQNRQRALADTVARGERDYVRVEYRLQVNDILQVTVRTLNAPETEIFNQPVNGMMGGGMMGGGDLFYLTGYTIDKTGDINLPVVGKVRVVGLTVTEVELLVVQEISKYFKNALTTVRLGGIRYAMLGEVSSPGQRLSLQNQLNIFEAIATAGDLTQVANRTEVQIIRQFPNGPRTIEIDLTDRELLFSPYYFVQPNDIIYVKPLKVKSFGVGVTGVSSFQTVASALSLGLTFFFLIRSFR